MAGNCTFTNNFICDFVAATNINSISGYEGWQCTSDKKPLTDPCIDHTSWFDLICRYDGCISVLSLSSVNIKGTLPENLYKISTLSNIELSYNLLSGTIPLLYTELPELTNLWLSGNLISGQLPSGMEKLTRLQAVNMDHNLLTGIIPSVFGQMSYLSYVILHNNRFNGTVPKEIFSPILWDLLLGYNELTGYIASEIGLASSLAFVNLESNQIMGTLPTSLGQLGSLSSFHVQNNRDINGQIPQELCDLSILSINVAGTGIDCYGGCLTSAAISVVGASSDCHSDYELHVFLSVLGGVVVGTAAAAVWYSRISRQQYSIPMYDTPTVV